MNKDRQYVNYFICVISLIINMFRIFIIGTTGVGKTKLSIELAKYLKGEVISSDSKQLYKHATIMTAKVTQEQAEGITHHMVDVLELHENTYNRNKFFTEAYDSLQKIEKLAKAPIVVGGTNYYTQTLLFDIPISNKTNLPESDDQGQNSGSKEEEINTNKQITEEMQKKLQEMFSLSKEQKYDMLKAYDSLIAEKVHKNNQQKVTLFLERIITNNRKISDNYQQLTYKLRSNNALVFWLRNSNKDELLGMITKRIHKMLDKAGITEIFAIYHYLHLHRANNQQESQSTIYKEYSGAASSIGIKEFISLYLEVRSHLINLLPIQLGKEVSYEHVHDIISKHFEELTYSKETLAKCTEQLIIDTKHYCKRQITWIRNRMFLHSEMARQHFFVLDLEQKEGDILDIHQRFESQIRKKAVQIIENIGKHGFGHILEDQRHFSENKAVALEQWKNYYCEPCKLEVNGQFDWNHHLKSKKHIKQAKYEQKKEERVEYIAKQKALAKERKQKKEANHEKQAEKEPSQ